MNSGKVKGRDEKWEVQRKRGYRLVEALSPLSFVVV